MREHTVYLTRRSPAAFPPELAPVPADVPQRAEERQAAIRRAATTGPNVLFLAGGDPATLVALPKLVAEARAAGVPAVAVLTTALPYADARRLAELVRAGVAAVHVLVPAVGNRYEMLANVPGGWAYLRSAFANLRAAGVQTAVHLPVAAVNASDAPAVVRWLATVDGPPPPVHLLCHVGPNGAVDSAPRVIAAIAETVAAGRETGVAVGFHGSHAPPPCLLPTTDDFVAVYDRTLPSSKRAAPRQEETCRGCALRWRCALPLEPWLAGGLSPPSDAPGADHPLARGGGGDVPAAPPLLEYDYGEGAPQTARVYVADRCDQRCRICDLWHQRPPAATTDELRSAILDAAARGVRRLILTGGEPTLRSDLGELVRVARGASVTDIELQTNAISLATGDAARGLAAAGITRALVSLHEAAPERSDALTRAPGTHARTVTGIDRLLDAGISVLVNCVVGTYNVASLEPFVRLVHARWGAHEGFLGLQLHTVVADPNEPERWRDLVAPLSRLGPALRAAIDLCHELGLAVTGPASPAGVPHCALEGDPRYLGPAEGPEEGRPHAAEASWFVRVAACEGCRAASRCPGPRRGYVAIHGTDGIHTLR